ncbi:MAG: RNA polymerase sigma factor [Pirellulaceae bacterium]|nr:RNA polymerase sigma factor [Pirellulaceae bacterium]
MVANELLLDVTNCTVAELVREAQAGNQEAQGALYERYQASCIALACRLLNNRDEAEELVQDVFIHAFARLDQLRVLEAFGGWLRQIVRRMAYNRSTRRHATYAAENELLEMIHVSEVTPLDEVLGMETREQVQAGLDKLGQLDRETLEAFYIGGQSLIEMSAGFAAPIGTIKRRLHVARKRLARELETHQAI